MDKKYIAVLGRSGARIISVVAGSLEDAEDEIERQLGKPGRVSVLEQWKSKGSFVEVEELEAKVMQVPPVLRQPVRTDKDSPAVDYIMRRFNVSNRAAAHDILKERD